MKIALISDIHGNWHALQAVFQDIEQSDLDEVWCLGDLVCFGAFSQKVVKTIRKSDITTIQGNVDVMLEDLAKEKKKWKDGIPEAELPFASAYQQLSKKSREYLKKSPATLKVKVNGMRFLLSHGSPEKNNEQLLPDTSEERYQELVDSGKADVILSGHTHLPLVKKVGKVTFVNPGSVGRPFDGDWRASYAILTAVKGEISVEHRKIEYDVDAAVTAVLDAGFPEDYAWVLKIGLPPDRVKEMQNKSK